MRATDGQLEQAFYIAALFLKNKVERRGWVWTSNFLREYVRAAFGFKFTNTKSPRILRKILRAHPELRPYIKIEGEE